MWLNTPELMIATNTPVDMLTAMILRISSSPCEIYTGDGKPNYRRL
ncbi:hypothetical protein NBRC111894_709 [Sporolactobacillus inulinus]|uniref:Uncharacterized protein n=1 Tax=Sporolactobacillus inulinus TaxID=2078 RepID=A0A4Y1Z839_9BACL|nr:hypothetical protein NBRC111894_709 [Sporolactobacillus inulinus]